VTQLIAQGELTQHHWRRRVARGRTVVVGRTATGWAASWDERISQLHVSIRLEERGLQVTKIPSARNPVFYQGRAQDTFVMAPGEHFVIGSTSFAFVEEQVGVTQDAPLPLTEQTFSRATLERQPFRNASRLIEAISRLPDIIGGASSDGELFVQLIGLLFQAIEAASFAAVVSVPRGAESGHTEVLHWDRRPGGQDNLAPSERLIHRAVEKQKSIVHIWHGDSAVPERTFTQRGEADWAFCTPVGGQSCVGWAIYVAGGGLERSGDQFAIDDPNELQDSVKFAELLAITLAHLRDLRHLERHKSTLGQFISPVVLEAVADRDPEIVLAPRETDVSVLFCDLRGFSSKSERAANDLTGLLNRVSLALGVMTRQILAQDGVIGDFHGDAAMGFWGWPLEQAGLAELASRAALEILAEFTVAQQSNQPLSDFRVGIGIASGAAVAGKIGTVDQVKVTVFGPVVNLAARLEEMTKVLRAPILIDETTAAALRSQVPRTVARVRRVARIRPYGLNLPVEVSQLLPPAAIYPQLSDEDIEAYESALDALLAGDWEKAFELLHRVPAEDRVKDFLTVFIAQNNRTPPDGWDGVISLKSSSYS
jgi:adenylate cyclase